MERILIKDLGDYISQEVTILCWVDTVRNQSKLVFYDFRDSTGFVQGVALLKNTESPESFTEVKKESSVRVRGLVKERPESNRREEVHNGHIELEVLEVEVLQASETPPFDLAEDGYEIDEKVRFEYRYLDLRRPRVQKNIIQRHKVMQYIRSFLSERDFFEIETPCLSKTTPEGARDYVVPSRVDQGKFYALPQSPQQYKQLLMVGGFEKYFQMARCFRDEDLRGDRQPEFTQIDVEMSFVTQEDVLKINEEMIVSLVQTLYPEKKLPTLPFPRITYADAMEKYGTDRPDLREDSNDSETLSFCWIVDFPFFEKDTQGAWTFTHNPFSAPQDEELLFNGEIEKVFAQQYDLVLNGFEIGGGSIRTNKPKVLQKIFEVLGYSKERIDSHFGHMLKAFSFGAPPHGGIAFGFDRLIMLLQNEPNIREVIAFPKTREGRELMLGSPSEIGVEQQQELGITLKRKPE